MVDRAIRARACYRAPKHQENSGFWLSRFTFCKGAWQLGRFVRISNRVVSQEEPQTWGFSRTHAERVDPLQGNQKEGGCMAQRKPKKLEVAIIVAIIGLVGTLLAALLHNWREIFHREGRVTVDATISEPVSEAYTMSRTSEGYTVSY